MPQVATQSPSSRNPPKLLAGEHLDQKTFHQRYEAMPETVKAELVGGIVYVASPESRNHGQPYTMLVGWLESYCLSTPGTDCFANVTTILGEFSEPQPDASLMVSPDWGGQSWFTNIGSGQYTQGPPEFVSEVSFSTESLDLIAKRRDYERAGVKEYLVVVVRQKRVVWFVRAPRKKGFIELQPGRGGILRSPFFGGLWLDPEALICGDRPTLHETLQRGLSSPEHARFVNSLALARSKLDPRRKK